MTAVDLLIQESELAFHELLVTLEGVSEATAWATIPGANPEAEYLHTDGSIQGIVLHVASCKIMYGSIAFRATEVRWRECAEHIASFEPNWGKAVEHLNEAHEYFMGTWSHLREADLEISVPHFSGELWPTWKIIRMMTHHDSYHAGQIAILKFALCGSSIPPPSYAEDIRQYCSNLGSW
jgi:hypothetical protein